MMYACTALWLNCSRSNRKALETIQHKALRSITRQPWFVRNETIRISLQIPTLEVFTRKTVEKFFVAIAASEHPHIAAIAEPYSGPDDYRRTTLRKRKINPRKKPRSQTWDLTGSFHQGNEQLYPTSKNSQCTAISACVLVWKVLCLEFSTTTIDTILITGDRVYNKLRDENRMGGNRYLSPDELPNHFLIHEQSVSVIGKTFLHDVLYPLAAGDMGDCILYLSNVLEGLMAEELMAEGFENIGFLFTGQTVTVAFWRSQEQLYMFDPHPVNEDRVYDVADDKNNLARIFQCENYSALATLLLSNAALDGSMRQFTVTRLRFDMPALGYSEPVQTNSETFEIIPQACNTRSKRHKENYFEYTKVTNIPQVILFPLKSVIKCKTIGRPMKIRRGRPKHSQQRETSK
ncbi:hypothetical protein J6590_103067 [Homalodisca vitripennis]|nr:hypothetical protein J6590_103067 [Homalodisca vitripennis]